MVSTDDTRAGEVAAETCKRCGHENPSWSAPSPLWNKVMRGNDINGDSRFDDIVCAACFIVLAVATGVVGGWTLTVDQLPDDLIYETPSGRMWSDAKGLWVDPIQDREVTAEEVERPVVSTIHIDLWQDEDDLGDKIAEVVYGGDYDALVHQHRQSCDESDHCCGSGSNYLTAHDARVRAADAAEIDRLREAVNREHGEPIDEVYTVDGLTIVMGTIHDLRAECDRLAAGVLELADEVEADARLMYRSDGSALFGKYVSTARLRALLAPADDGQVRP